MSSFAALPIDARTTPFDALVAASGKCLEGAPGMGFVFVAQERARAVRGQLALAGDGPARPVDVHGEDDAVALYAADARRRRARRGDRPVRRGGRPAGAAGALRAQLRDARSTAWRSSAFAPFLEPEIQAPIIVTFHAPADPRTTSSASTTASATSGFILYPGKLTQVETFRVGCIGAIGPDEMRHAVNAVRDTLREMGIRQVSPAAAARRAWPRDEAPA